MYKRVCEILMKVQRPSERSRIKFEMETNLKEYIVYMTINLVNNKIYIGVHKTENPNIFDGYIGCNVKINSPSTYMNPSTPFQYAV